MVLWIGPILRAVTGQERQRPGYDAFRPTPSQASYAGQYAAPSPYHSHQHQYHQHHQQNSQPPVQYVVPVGPQPLNKWERKQARKADRLARKAQRYGLPMPVAVAVPAPAPAPYGHDYAIPTGQTLSGGGRASGSGNWADIDVATPPAGPPPRSARGYTKDRRASFDEEEVGSESDLPPTYETAVAGPSRRRSVEVLSSGGKRER